MIDNKRTKAWLWVTFGWLLFGLLTAPSLIAQGFSDSTGANKLSLANGSVFYATDHPVLERRDLQLPNSDKAIHTWKVQLPNGQIRNLYAVSRGGSELLGRVRTTENRIRLSGYRFDPLVNGPPVLEDAVSARPQNSVYLVQMVATPLPEMRSAINSAGGKIFRFITDNTFIVEMSSQAKATVEQLSFVRWVGPYHAAYRLEEGIRSGGSGGPVGSIKSERYSIMLFERGARQSTVAQQIEALGGVVDMIEPGGWRLEATLNQRQILEIAHLNEVQYIDTWGGPGETDMIAVRDAGGGNYVENVAGYTGQGVRGEVFDSELLTSHVEWPTAPIIHGNLAENCSTVLHGTSAYSNNFAQGVDADARGMVPDAQGIFFCHTESAQFGGSISRYTANAELIDPVGPYRAVYQTSSIGSARTTSYTTLSAETDDYLFQHQILSTQSQSNAGNRQSRPQAWSKNIVSVGGFNHENTANRCDDNWSFTASIGPAQDGRIKPDLAFFYDSIRSARGSGNAAYSNFGGTSSATPQTSGHFGLFFQMWHDGVWAGHGGGADVFDSRPQMATAKAMMINNAFRYDWNNPGGCSFGDIDRFKQGWGTADVQRLYDRAPVTSIIDETDLLSPLETNSYNVVVQSGETELNVTMVYTDPMGTVGAAEHRVNDLSLRVTSPGGTSYWGNNGLTQGNFSTSGGSSNTVDTVENVFIQNPAAGNWLVEVIGDEIVQDSHVETAATDADYALVVSGGLIGSACTPQPVANAGADQTIGSGESATIGTGALAGHSYSWSPSGQTSAQISVSPASTTTYTVTATTACGSANDSVTVTVNPIGGSCFHSTDFESNAGGWTNGADSCTTGSFIVGTPDATAWQVGSGNPGQAFFTQNNAGGIGLDDVDNGTCEALSPVVACDGESAVEVSFDYYHGQRDANDDANDGFTVEVLNNGAVVDTVVSIGDVQNTAAWTSATAVITNPGDIQVRVRATDAAGAGDIVEAGIDNVLIMPTTVNSPPSVTISSPANGTTVDQGVSVSFSGSANDAEDGSLSAGLSWTSNIDGNIGSGASFSTSTLSLGTHNVTAFVTDSGGASGSSNVSITVVEPPPPACTVEVDFESGAAGWTNSGSSTCSTGLFVVGTPDQVVNGGVTTQLGGDHTTGSGNAFFSADNAAGAGLNDVDNGNCIVNSPVYPVAAASNVTLFYYHGQRDAGDDAAGDFFQLEMSTNGGSTFNTLASHGDVVVNAAWTEVNTTVPAGADVQFRLQVSDGSAAGDLVEAGIDDISICPQ